jgi:hypothetical protein
MRRNKVRITRLAILAFVGILVWFSPSRSSSQSPSSQSPANKKPEAPQSFAPPLDWRPTHAPAGARYVGSKACAECHANLVAAQQETPMARALETVEEGRILRRHALLTFRIGAYSYKITREGPRSLYEVSDGKDTISVPIQWAFGQGKAGQTYVVQLNGKYYESRVSFYNDVGGLDLTMGAPRAEPRSLTEAVGHLLDGADARDCFSCHATAAVSGARLQTDRMTPGVSCEGCHGPGEKHVAAMKARDFANRQILNPGRFDTNGQTEFCGACHRSWTQVMLMPPQGMGNVRFQPYRIFGSKCYSFEDKRISCAACHDPHTEMRREPAFYDSKCLACHQSGAGVGKAAPAEATPNAPACKVGKQNCAECHMPKYELPGSHFKFTDHRIRVAKPGAPYPE